jgi:hypothetical protein
MATARRVVAVEDLDNELHSVSHHYRGHTYVIRELPMVDYQRQVRAATTTEKDPITGEETDKFDADHHTALMLGKCVTVDGKKTTAEALYEKGTALVRQLQRDVSALHFDEEKDEPLEEDEPDAEGEAAAESA